MKKIALFFVCAAQNIFNLPLYAQQFDVVGNASTLSCSCYQLTPPADYQGGAVWNENAINLAHPFDFKFRVFFGDANPNHQNSCGPGADGMCFVLQNTDSGLSQNGEGMGYGGFTNPSVAIELDTWQNPWDPPYSHLAIEDSGQVMHSVGTLAGPVQMSATEYYTNDSNWHTFEVFWDTSSQTLGAYFDGVFRISYAFPGGIINYIFHGNASPVYWGFTGGTGAYCNIQQMCLNASANFTAQTSQTNCGANSATFSNTSTSSLGSIKSYAWIFGDGDTSSQANPTHRYAASGAYPVSLIITDQSLCTDTVTHIVAVGTPKVTDSLFGANCQGNTGFALVNITGGGGGYHVIWDPGPSSITQTGNSYLVKQPTPGPYHIYATDTLSGCSDTIQFTVPVDGTPVLSLSYHNLVCSETLRDTVAVGVVVNAPVTYLWSNGSTTSSVVIPTAFSGDTDIDYIHFSVTVKTDSGCSATISDSIAKDPQISNTNILTLYRCAKPAHGDLQLDGKGGTGMLTYTVGDAGTNNTGRFPGLPPGTYAFTITDTAGCVQPGNVTIPNSIANDSFVVTTDSATCYGFNDGEIIVTPKNPDDGPFVYQLDGGSFNFGDTFTNIPAGPHEVVAKSFVFGCQYIYAANVNQPAQHLLSINPDTIMTMPGTFDTVTVSTDFPNPVYIWSPVTALSCTSCSAPVITADTVNTSYTVKVYGAQDSSCYSTDSVIVIVKPPVLPDSLLMPSAFTPNGDGKNDKFGPVESSLYANPVIKTFRIYNRWGQLIFNGNEAWDGKFDGKAQPVGTYVYYIEVQYPADINNPSRIAKKEGSVTLLR